jgi:phenylacetate-CoA ligase
MVPCSAAIKLRGLIPDRLIYKNAYPSYMKLIKDSEQWSIEQKKKYIFNKMTKLVTHAYKNVEFYRKFYKEKQFHPSLLKNFSDITKIPEVKKQDLKNVSLSKRSDKKIPSANCSSGGTSGQPFQFKLDQKTSISREWAHMEVIWKSTDYLRNSIRLRFHGRDLGERKIAFSAILGEIAINIWANPDDIAKELKKHDSINFVRFIHGYPGIIYEMTRRWESKSPWLIHKLSKQINGILLSSEYPSKIHRKYLENIYNAKSVSWYGHSEMAVLANEREKPYIYEPFVTYGFAEAVNYPDGVHLISTGWDNLSHPFIRYDTGDLIDPICKDGLMHAFKIKEGRASEFILDKYGRKISLTGLIFGRHHDNFIHSKKLFEYAEFIQINQERQGEATIYIITQDDKISSDLISLFNFKDVKIDFSFDIRKKPFRTSIGKIPLLVSKQKKQ